MAGIQWVGRLVLDLILSLATKSGLFRYIKYFQVWPIYRDLTVINEVMKIIKANNKA